MYLGRVQKETAVWFYLRPKKLGFLRMDFIAYKQVGE